MCLQAYESFTLCPCQVKFGSLTKCDDPTRCHSTRTVVYCYDSSYCAYHAQRNAHSENSRSKFFSLMGVSPSSKTAQSIPAKAPVLGRVIGGAALSTAFIGSEEDFANAYTRNRVDDSSDDSDSGKPPVNQEPWDLTRATDRAELAQRREDFWARVASPGRAYWRPSARARRDPWGKGPRKTGRKKSKTWAEWKKVRREKRKARALARKKEKQSRLLDFLEP